MVNVYKKQGQKWGILVILIKMDFRRGFFQGNEGEKSIGFPFWLRRCGRCGGSAPPTPDDAHFTHTGTWVGEKSCIHWGIQTPRMTLCYDTFIFNRREKMK